MHCSESVRARALKKANLDIWIALSVAFKDGPRDLERSLDQLFGSNLSPKNFVAPPSAPPYHIYFFLNTFETGHQAPSLIDRQLKIPDQDPN